MPQRKRSLFTVVLGSIVIGLFLYVALSKPLYMLEEKINCPRPGEDRQGNRILLLADAPMGDGGFFYGYFVPLNYLREKSMAFDRIMYWYTGRPLFSRFFSYRVSN